MERIVVQIIFNFRWNRTGCITNIVESMLNMICTVVYFFQNISIDNGLDIDSRHFDMIVHGSLFYPLLLKI